MYLEVEEAKADIFYLPNKPFTSITKNTDISRVLRSDSVMYIEIGKVTFCKNEFNQIRYLLQVSKKVGNAVVRNRIKRRMRAAIKLCNLHHIDIAIRCNVKILTMPFQGLILQLNNIQHT